MSVRVAIVGSRAHPNLAMVREYVTALHDLDTVVSGGARGVDRAAAIAAQARGLSTVEYVPRYVSEDKTDGIVIDVIKDGTVTARMPMPAHVSMRDALILRNSMIVALAERCVAFPDGTDGGTWDSVRQAKRFRRPCEIRWCDGRIVDAYAEEWPREGRLPRAND